MSVGKIDRSSMYPRIAQNQNYVAGANQTINLSTAKPWNAIHYSVVGRVDSAHAAAAALVRTLHDMIRRMRVRSTSQKDIFNGQGIHLFMLQALMGHEPYEYVATTAIDTATYFEFGGTIPCKTVIGEGSVQCDIEWAAVAAVFTQTPDNLFANLEISLDFISKDYGLGYSWEGVDESGQLAGAVGTRHFTTPISKDGQHLHMIALLPLYSTGTLPSAIVGVKSETGRWNLSDGTADVFNTRFHHSRLRAKMNAHHQPPEIAGILDGLDEATVMTNSKLSQGIVFEQFAEVPASVTNRLNVEIDALEDNAWSTVYALYGFKQPRA